MAQFSDRHGQAWCVDIVHGDVAELREQYGIVPRFQDDQFIQSLDVVFGDIDRFAALLGFLCREQIAERGLTPEAWARLFTMEIFDAAADAVLEAFADFSQRSRGARRAIRQKLREELTTLDLRMEAATHARWTTSSDSAGNSPVSSALTPAP